jgi:hypothetical protein
VKIATLALFALVLGCSDATDFATVVEAPPEVVCDSKDETLCDGGTEDAAPEAPQPDASKGN